MVNIALITTALKGFTVFWSLLVLAVSAAMVHMWDDHAGSRFETPGFGPGISVLAAAILSSIYFTAAFLLLFIRPKSILISVLADISVLTFLLILDLGCVSALTDMADFFRRCRAGDKFCSLAEATQGLGWVLVFLILGILCLEIMVTLLAIGRLDTWSWKAPFNEFVPHRRPSSGSRRRAENRAEVGMTAVGGPQVGQAA